MPRYAQINQDNVCVSVSTLKADVNAPHMILIADDVNPIRHIWDDGEWIAPELEPQAPATPIPAIVASGVFSVTEGWVEGLEAAAGIGMAFSLDVGVYWLFFTEAQLDLSFAVYASASSGQINVSSRSIDYVELCVTDGGNPVDPAEFSINIVRAQ